MSKLSLNQTNFTSGEVSPSLYGRVDLSKYANGAAVLENLIVKPQGGFFRRPGTRYVGTVRNSSGYRKIIPFQFNTTQNYILEFTNLKMRVWKNDALQGGGTPTEYTSPYYGSHVKDLKFCQSADTLWITHPLYPPYVVTRDSSEVFAVTRYTFEDGPYLSRDEQVPVYITNYAHTAKLRVLSGTLTFASPADVNKFIEYKQDSVWKLAKITSVIDATHVNVTVIDNIITDVDGSTRINYWFRRSHSTPDIFDDPSPFHFIKPGSTVVSGGGNLTASEGVFSRKDKGKYCRDNNGVNEGTWALITAFTSPTQVAATVQTMKAYTYPTDLVELYDEVRSCWITVRSGGTDGAGKDYFKIASPLTGSVTGWTYGQADRHVRFEFSSFTCWGKLSNALGSNGDSYSVILYQNLPQDFNDGRIQVAQDGVPTSWKLGAWSGVYFDSPDFDFWGVGWPSVCVFHEQRLTFARTYTEPQTLWMSRPNDYGNFSPTELDSQVTDENAISYTLVSRQVNEVRWLESGPVLIVGTSGGEFQVKAASSIAAPLTPSNISVTPQSTIGATSRTTGKRVNGAVMFLDRAGRKLRHMQYNFELDAFVTKDLNILSDHIITNSDATTGLQIAFQQEPNQLMWVLREDGKLACLTYEPDQEVYAWTKHYLGAGATAAIIEDMCVITSPTGDQDRLYFIVKRVINSATVYYLERLEDLFKPTSSTDISGQPFTDCALIYSGASATTISGLTHLIGETVRVLADGIDVGSKVVNGSGQITLSTAATYVRVGYQADATMQTLRPEAPQPGGTSQGKIKRVHEVVVRVRDTRDFRIGADVNNLIEQKMRGVQDPIGNEAASTALFSGDVRCALEKSWTTDGQFIIIQTRPYNLHVISIMPDVTVTK
jgi:hypothetical protein